MPNQKVEYLWADVRWLCTCTTQGASSHCPTIVPRLPGSRRRHAQHTSRSHGPCMAQSAVASQKRKLADLIVYNASITYARHARRIQEQLQQTKCKAHADWMAFAVCSLHMHPNQHTGLMSALNWLEEVDVNHTCACPDSLSPTVVCS